MAKKIFFITGEPSGDSLGAGLMKSLKAKDPSVELNGIGGPLMEEEGLESLIPMDELCVMGIWEVVSHLPRLMRLINGIVEEIEKQQPDVVVTIDLPDFNFQVGERLKKRGISKAKVIHYVAPTVWAWRPKRAERIAGFLDGLMCLFPFEPDYFKPHNLRAEYVGHPITEKDLNTINREAFREKYSLEEGSLTLGLFFGSRIGEIQLMKNVLMETASTLLEQYPDMNIIVPTLPNLEFDLRKALEKWDCDYIIVASNDELKWDASASCDIALAVSGTVGLELAYLGIPHVIGYKMHPVTWTLIRYLAKVKHAHLANIIMDRDLVPEFLQTQCTSLKMSKALMGMLKKPDIREEQIKAFAELRQSLALPPGQVASGKAADFILESFQS